MRAWHPLIIVGSVNANKRHWCRAGQVLANSDRSRLARLITRCEPPEAFMHALQRQPDDIKVVIQFAQA
jgi:threonine dehydrogenase-like Zn-dependent dehydrogenase